MNEMEYDYNLFYSKFSRVLIFAKVQISPPEITKKKKVKFRVLDKI